MIIPIKRDGNLEDWAMIELQGDLTFDSTEICKNRHIGDLHFTKTGLPIFIIGTHVLHGKEMQLEKPFAVLEKKCNKIDGTPKTEYAVKGIVRKKIVFKTRPKPIITNVAKPV